MLQNAGDAEEAGVGPEVGTTELEEKKKEHFEKLSKLLKSIEAVDKKVRGYQQRYEQPMLGLSRLSSRNLKIVPNSIETPIEKSIKNIKSVDDVIDFSPLESFLKQQETILAPLIEKSFRAQYEPIKKRALEKIDQIRKVDSGKANESEEYFIKWRLRVGESEASKENVLQLAVELDGEFNNAYLDCLTQYAESELNERIKEAKSLNGEISLFESQKSFCAIKKTEMDALTATARTALSVLPAFGSKFDDYKQTVATILSPLDSHIEDKLRPKLLALQNAQKKKTGGSFKLFKAPPTTPVNKKKQGGVVSKTPQTPGTLIDSSIASMKLAGTPSPR